MTFQVSSQSRTSVSDLPDKLGVARQALADSQCMYQPGSPGWHAAQTLIESIDALLPLFAAGHAGSTGRSINVGSGSNRPTSGRREGVIHGWRPEAGRVKHLSLEGFTIQVREKGRIGKYDVHTVRETFLKGGLTSRTEADLLIALDREVDSVHVSWPAFFISTLTAFVVWDSGRPGHVDEEQSKWLLARLVTQGTTDRGRRALATIAQQAEYLDDAFFAGTAPAEAKRSQTLEELELAA
jgi:hypothetical protein